MYHEFDEIKESLKEAMLEMMPSRAGKDKDKPYYDIHHLVVNGPKGMDPCQTLDQRVYGMQKFDKIEKLYEKEQRKKKIRQASEAEGVFHEVIHEFPIPQPCSYHSYCQVCMKNYEDFETHVTSHSHLHRARKQGNLLDIDDLISEMNVKERWKQMAPEP